MISFSWANLTQQLWTPNKNTNVIMLCCRAQLESRTTERGICEFWEMDYLISVNAICILVFVSAYISTATCVRARAAIVNQCRNRMDGCHIIHAFIYNETKLWEQHWKLQLRRNVFARSHSISFFFPCESKLRVNIPVCTHILGQ